MAKEYIIDEKRVQDLNKYMVRCNVPENHRDYICGRLRSHPHITESKVDLMDEIILNIRQHPLWNDNAIFSYLVEIRVREESKLREQEQS